MPNVLVLGDLIIDRYRMCTATRLCPEGPVPVLTNETVRESQGGAGLVVAQLGALLDKGDVVSGLYGSQSIKERIFADDRLMLRVDQDSKYVADPKEYLADIENELRTGSYNAIIVSDYGKGSFDQQLGEWLIRRADDYKIPAFVDAKQTWWYYCGAFAMFPNKSESASYEFVAKHVIQKLGANGCEVDRVHISTNNHPVRDVTGAGDVFLAAFVHKWLDEQSRGAWAGTSIPRFSDEEWLTASARFANIVAGISVEHVGTHVVTKEELENY